MELQKAILSYSGDEIFKENSRVGKVTHASPTLSEVMNSDDAFNFAFAGLGDIYIAKKKDISDGKKNAWFPVGRGLYKPEEDNNEVVSSSSVENPFRVSYPLKIEFDDTPVGIHHACVLAKSVLPYHNVLPFFVKKDDKKWWNEDYISKKPWRYYQLPKLQVFIFPLSEEFRFILMVNDMVIADLSSIQYHILSGRGNINN